MSGSEQSTLYLTELLCTQCGTTTNIAHRGEPTAVDQEAPWPDVSNCARCCAYYPDDLGEAIVTVHEAEIDSSPEVRADGGSEQSDESIFDSDGKAWNASKRDLEDMVADHYGVDGLWLKDDSLVYFDGDEEHVVSDDVGLYGHDPSGAVCVREDELPSQDRVETVVEQAGDRDD